MEMLTLLCVHKILPRLCFLFIIIEKNILSVIDLSDYVLYIVYRCAVLVLRVSFGFLKNRRPKLELFT